jgi:CRP-like cAMP-binding protein
MEQLRQTIRHMIAISDDELQGLLDSCFLKTFRRKELLSQPGKVCDEIFFIKKGIIRVIIDDKNGQENTVHFALENQFNADYGSFIQQTPSIYSLQALEITDTVVLPRAAIDWGYQNLQQGDRLGRMIAEYYFIYLDNRIQNLYANNPKERYDGINQIFPNIHNRAPQHMIASYLGITPIHLSRLKKTDRRKT